MVMISLGNHNLHVGAQPSAASVEGLYPRISLAIEKKPRKYGVRVQKSVEEAV